MRERRGEARFRRFRVSLRARSRGMSSFPALETDKRIAARLSAVSRVTTAIAYFFTFSPIGAQLLKLLESFGAIGSSRRTRRWI